MRIQINRIINLLTKYFDKTRRYSTFRLIIEFTLLDLAAKIVVVLSISILIFAPLGLISGNGLELIDKFFIDQEFTKDMSIVELAITSMIIFPPLETLLFQILPIWLLSLFTKKRVLLISFSAVIFALIHIEPQAIIIILPGGILLSWVYLIKKEKSRWKAFWITTILHVSMNGTAILMRIFFP